MDTVSPSLTENSLSQYLALTFQPSGESHTLFSATRKGLFGEKNITITLAPEFHTERPCEKLYLKAFDKSGQEVGNQSFSKPGEVLKLTLKSGSLWFLVDSEPIGQFSELRDRDRGRNKELHEISYKSWQRDWAETFIIAFILANFIRTFVAQAYYIPSSSMENNLYPNDRIIVNKFAYGINFNNPLTHKNFRIPVEEPQRYDVVIFRFPENQKRMFIKRMIGLPGDKLEIKDGVLYINDTKARDDFLKTKDMVDIFTSSKLMEFGSLVLGETTDAGFEKAIKERHPHLLRQFQGDYLKVADFLRTEVEKLRSRFDLDRFSFDERPLPYSYNWGPIYIPGKDDKILKKSMSQTEYDYYVKYFRNVKGKVFYKIEGRNSRPITLKSGDKITNTAYFLDDKKLDPNSFTLGEDLFFAMGDNRNNSSDSRDWGFLPRTLIDGEALLLYYPFKRGKLIQ